MKLQDPKAVVIHTIPESDSGFTNNEYVYQFPDNTWDRITSGTPLRLFIQDDDMAEFEIASSDIESCKVP